GHDPSLSPVEVRCRRRFLSDAPTADRRCSAATTSRGTRDRHELRVRDVYFELCTAASEPTTDVGEVAVQVLECMGVGGHVDGLRKVDQQETVLPPQEVVGR